jgi:hypothetical protein
VRARSVIPRRDVLRGRVPAGTRTAILAFVRPSAARLHSRPPSGAMGDRVRGPSEGLGVPYSREVGLAPDVNVRSRSSALIATVGLIAEPGRGRRGGIRALEGPGVAKLEAADVGLRLSHLRGWATLGLLVTLGLILGAGESLPLVLSARRSRSWPVSGSPGRALRFRYPGGPVAQPVRACSHLGRLGAGRRAAASARRSPPRPSGTPPRTSTRSTSGSRRLR